MGLINPGQLMRQSRMGRFLKKKWNRIVCCQFCVKCWYSANDSMRSNLHSNRMGRSCSIHAQLSSIVVVNCHLSTFIRPDLSCEATAHLTENNILWCNGHVTTNFKLNDITFPAVSRRKMHWLVGLLAIIRLLSRIHRPSVAVVRQKTARRH